MGYWPSVQLRWLNIGQVLFLHVYGPRWSQDLGQDLGQYPAILTEQAWSIKDLYGFWENFSHRTWRVVPSILPARVANHSVQFGSSCSLMEQAYNKYYSIIIITCRNYKSNPCIDWLLPEHLQDIDTWMAHTEWCQNDKSKQYLHVCWSLFQLHCKDATDLWQINVKPVNFTL